jgi:putative holliday junction resolvase
MSDDPANQTPDDAPVPFPTDGRLLGVDYGTKRIGLAYSPPEQNMAVPLANYDRFNDDVDGKYMRAVVEEYRIAGIVVGLPVHTDGGESQKSREARAYGAKLAEITGLPVTFWDERYTSQEAEAALIEMDVSRRKRKGRLDKVAAMYMLQAFLDADDRTAPPNPHTRW